MKTDLFDFELPENLIAQTPAAKRSESRLLVYNRESDRVEHKRFKDIVEYFAPGDLLILNSSKVIPARLYTIAGEHGSGGCELLFVKKLEAGHFMAMVRPGKKFKPGRLHTIAEGLDVEVIKIHDDGLREIRTLDGSDPVDVFRRCGEMPLPPYITSRASSPDRYQTVYSDVEGSIAAPTAGLHFDQDVFSALEDRGVKTAQIILHVGLGTFKPVEVDDLSHHRMHEEVFHISAETAGLFRETRAAGGNVWACGTTTVRTLEAAIDKNGELQTGWQQTDIFIKPGHEFKAVDRFITNFHLPKSTLIVLVSAFSTREKVLQLYQEAVAQKYRFYSFGDSMVIL